MEAAVLHNLTLTVCEKYNIAIMEKICKALGKSIDVHLKVDTGMGRIGVSVDEAENLALYIERECPHLHLDGIYTHLPVSDDGDPTYTEDQILGFKEIVDQINERIGRKVNLTHCSNSGAVLGHPSAWLDLVRPGIMIYGFYPGKDTPKSIPLKPGLSFLTRVSFLKKVSAGTSIGYGRTWIAPEDTWIATIPVGYADGFNRLFSNRGRVLIKREIISDCRTCLYGSEHGEFGAKHRHSSWR